MDPEVRRFPSLAELNLFAARHILACAQSAVKERGLFSLALSGGSTPRKLYELLAAAPFSEQMPWKQTHLFWVDERAVPSNDPASNYALVKPLLVAVPIPARNVHRMPADTPDLEKSAIVYETLIRSVVPSKPGEIPSIDLVLLGIGNDGHTASIFPGDPLVQEDRKLVAALTGPRGSPAIPRLTMTFPLINAAASAAFLVSGGGKKAIVQAILEDRVKAAKSYPAARVHPAAGAIWFLDSEYV